MGELALPIRSLPELALAGPLSSDERLARLASRGSARAFAALYQRHHQALYRYCRSIVRDDHDAQDALQSAMTRALVALRAEERDLAVRPWLFRIVHNEAVLILRKRQPTVALEEGLGPADPGVERTREERERLATLVADLQALSERQRSALVMRELSGLSIQEIGEALSTTPGAAKQVIFEARRALAEFAEGRAMECEQIRRAISDGDRRVLRGRKLRGHLRECRGCRDFQAAISARGADLRALVPPLPGAAATTILGRLLAHGVGGGHGGGVVAGSGATLGNSAAASLTVKTLAAAATVTVAVAGGAHIALVGQRHHPPRAATRQGTRVTHSALATAHTAGPSGMPPSVAATAISRLVRGGATASASIRDGVKPDARASTSAPLTASVDTNAVQGSPGAARGHGSATSSEGRGVARDTHTRDTSRARNAGRRRRSEPSQARRHESASRKGTPARPAKPATRHGNAGAATGRPAPQVPSTGHEEASAKTQGHGAPAGTHADNSGAEAHAPSAAAGPPSAAAGPPSTAAERHAATAAEGHAPTAAENP